MKLHHYIFDSLRTKIIILVLLSLAPSCILIYYTSQHERSVLRRAAFHDALTLAKNLSNQQEQLINDAGRTLFSVSQIFESIEYRRIDSQKILSEFQKQNPQLISIFIAKPDGAVVASSADLPKRFNISDRPIYHVVTQQKAFAIGEYQMARIARRPILSMAYPILGDNGQIKTIYLTGLDLTRIDQFISKSELPVGTLLTIIDRNGTLLYQYPNAPNRIGKETGNMRSAKEIVNRKEGTLEIVDDDGVERLYGFSSFGIPKGSVFIAVAIPKKEAFATINALIYNQIIWFGIVLFLAISAAWMVSFHIIIKPLNNIVHAAQLIAGGNLTSRIDDKGGQGEIHSLSQSFNQMAEALRQRLEERGKAEDALRAAVNTTFQVMASAVEARDPYTAGHQIRSANIARAIATEMKLSRDKIEGIRIAGSIHDIGKLGLPAEILTKPTKLSELEFALIKEHSTIGFEILKNVESPWPLAEIVYQHHERMDGTGYPRQLQGEEILMEARILMVADVVEAMASHRPYRPGLGIDAALNEIEKNRGVFYDNAVADACLTLFREKGFKLEET